MKFLVGGPHMKNLYSKRNIHPVPIIFVIMLFFTFISTSSANSKEESGEELYKKLTAIARGKGDVATFNKLSNEARKLNWGKSETLEFAGNLRLIEAVKNKKTKEIQKLYHTGKASITVRGVAEIIEKKNNSFQILLAQYICI